MKKTAALFAFLAIPALSGAAAYTWKPVQAHGGGFVDGIIYHPTTAGLVYARTDMGGAYRWDGATSTWIPLTDYLVRGQADFMGVLSLALDPNDASRVYLMTGKYTQSWAGTGALLASTNQGASWTQVNLSVKVGGNEDGRGAGERLQVDPNLGSTLFMGTTADGLWKSTNYGSTWARVASFTPTNVNFVMIDASSGVAGSASPRIFVGANNASSFWRSNDGGTTWTAVAGQPTGQMALRAARAGGIVYSTWSNGVGPNNSTAGAVWKYTVASGAWANISPPSGQGGYGGISVDAQNANTLLVSTLDRWWPADEILRSTNGGASWTPLLAGAVWDHSKAPYTVSSTPHWVTDVQIDPFDRNKAFFVTGYGVWICQNLLAADSAAATTWGFEDDGIEQSVPLQIISPPSGAPVLSAMGDIDGFKHDNPDISPPAGRFKPEVGTTLAIAFAESVPTKMVKAYNQAPYGAYSTDGGANWTAFASSPAGSSGGGTRSIAISPNGTNIVWSPAGGQASYSTNNGGSWAASTGGMPAGLEIVADRVNSSKFYAADALNGRVWVSTNGGVSFALGATGLPTLPSYLLGDCKIKANFATEGDLWMTLGSNGLYHSTNSGATFTKLATVTVAYEVGLGKAAPAQPYPALFINGTVGGAFGFHRSDDGGATWVRINDDQHQYGYTHDLSGDPRIYGRLYTCAEGRGVLYAEMPLGTPTNTPSVTPSPTQVPVDGPLRIDAVSAVPNPGPSGICVLMAGSADSLKITIWTRGLAKAWEFPAGPVPAGWSSLPMPSEFLAQASNGLYYFNVTARRGALVTRFAPGGKFLILR